MKPGTFPLPKNVALMVFCAATEQGVERVRKLLEGAESPEEVGRRLIADLDAPLTIPCHRCGDPIEKGGGIFCLTCEGYPEEKISERYVYSFNAEDGGTRDTPARVVSHVYANYSPGEVYCTHAGAPGTGRKVWEVTRKDEEAIYGRVLENTIRILEPWEVE